MQKYILITITTALILSLILCLVLFVYIRRQNKELNYINGILKEINAGNRNRKIPIPSLPTSALESIFCCRIRRIQ